MTDVNADALRSNCWGETVGEPFDPMGHVAENEKYGAALSPKDSPLRFRMGCATEPG